MRLTTVLQAFQIVLKPYSLNAVCLVDSPNLIYQRRRCQSRRWGQCLTSDFLVQQRDRIACLHHPLYQNGPIYSGIACVGIGHMLNNFGVGF